MKPRPGCWPRLIFLKAEIQCRSVRHDIGDPGCGSVPRHDDFQLGFFAPARALSTGGSRADGERQKSRLGTFGLLRLQKMEGSF